jgi:hypothetical protein
VFQVFPGEVPVVALVTHRPDELSPVPTHAVLLGRGVGGTGYASGDWATMRPLVEAFFQAEEVQTHFLEDLLYFLLTFFENIKMFLLLIFPFYVLWWKL